MQRSTYDQQSVIDQKLRQMIAHSLMKYNEWPDPGEVDSTSSPIDNPRRRPRQDNLLVEPFCCPQQIRRLLAGLSFQKGECLVWKY